MFLRKMTGANNPSTARNHGASTRSIQGVSGRREGEVGVVFDVAVGTAGPAGLGARAERLVDDALDGAGATTAFGAATEAAIELLGVARKDICRTHGVADVVIAEDVTGTNNH
jgi:hypothetical protein